MSRQRVTTAHGVLIALTLFGCGSSEEAHVAATKSAIETNAPVVIRQVYARNLDGSSEVKCDFIELFNRSSASVYMQGWSVQRLFTGQSQQVLPLPRTRLDPGQSYLIQEQCDPGSTLPVVPDLVDPTPYPALRGTYEYAGGTGGFALSIAISRSVTPISFPGVGTPIRVASTTLVLSTWWAAT